MWVQGYQRLEILGDAVLNLLMTRYYFTAYRCPQPYHPFEDLDADCQCHVCCWSAVQLAN